MSKLSKSSKDNKIHLTEDFSDYEFTFDDNAELAKFFDEEVTNLQVVKQNTEIHFLSSIGVYSECSKLIHGYEKSGTLDSRNIHDEITQKLQTRAFKLFSTSPWGSKLVSLSEKHPKIANEAYLCISNQVQWTNNRLLSKEFLFGCIFAYSIIYGTFFDESMQNSFDRRVTNAIANANQSESKLNTTHESFKAKLSNLLGEIETAKSAHEKSSKEAVFKQKEEFDTVINNAKKQIKELESTYGEKLKLEGPVAYWQQRATKFHKSFKRFRFALVVTVISSLFLLLFILYNYPVCFQKSVIEFDFSLVKGIIILATIISISSYLISMFSRMMLSSLHLQRDAEEKEQLTMVYLALIKKQPAADEDRHLILQSLFSRVDTGLLKGESGPTLPSPIGKVIDQSS